MKRILIAILFLSGLELFAQAPNFLNYQGVARDASNNIITTNIGLKFEILQGSATGTVSYAETNSAIPSSAGIFTAAIGSGAVISSGTFPMIDWASGPYFIRVSLDPTGGSSYSVIGTSQLLSVPYALYAAKAGSGSSMPTGTLTGQTMYWNNTSNSWVINNNILNDGTQVVVGENMINGSNKMRVSTYNPSDSAALFVYHTNSAANQAAIRGFASGTAANSGSLTINPIVGGHFIGVNVNNNGTSVGAVAQGNSPGGDAIGAIAIGSSSSTATGKSIGLYATSFGPVQFNNFAAVFDKGKVLINDSIIVGTPGGFGDILTRGLNGRTHWAPAAGAGPWTRTNIGGTDNVHLTTNGDFVNIGLPTGVGANEKLHVHNTTGDAYINLSTSIASNNVGLVFGQSSNISKAFLTFDNTSNSLTYRHFNKRVFFMDGASQTFYFGKIPIGAASINAMNIYDSVFSTAPRPILRLINTAGSAGNNPAAMFMGDDSNNGMTLVYDKQGSVDHMHIGNTFVNTFYHTFTSSGEFYPGSNGGAGFPNIASTGATSADLNFNASTTGRIIFNTGHIKASGASPALTFTATGTNLSSVPFTASFVGASNNDTKGYLRAACTFSCVFTPYNSTSDELAYTVIFSKPYAIAPTVVVSPANDVLGLSYHTTILPGNSGFRLIVRNQSGVGISVNGGYQFDFNYIVIE